MKKIDTFPDSVRIDMAAVHNGFCHAYKCFKKITSFHHKLKNTPYNRAHYPLFIQSVFNCFPSCDDDHTHYADKKIEEKEAQVYEKYLEKIIITMPF